MLAFDIETTGLDRERCEVTVVCTEDFQTGERSAFEFGRVAAGEACGLERQKLTLELVKAFDAAESLCAFKGVRFDVPFLYKAFAVGGDRGRMAREDDGHPGGLQARGVRPAAHVRPESAVRAQRGADEVRVGL